MSDATRPWWEAGETNLAICAKADVSWLVRNYGYMPVMDLMAELAADRFAQYGCQDDKALADALSAAALAVIRSVPDMRATKAEVDQ